MCIIVPNIWFTETYIIFNSVDKIFILIRYSFIQLINYKVILNNTVILD